jgi:hypothetical protein
MDFARYIGTATVRRMTEAQWKSAGIENQGSVEWTAANGYAVGRDRFSDAAWEALGNDPGIVFTGSRPEAAEMDDAAVNAAITRLRARQEGNEVLHRQDDVPGEVA